LIPKEVLDYYQWPSLWRYYCAWSCNARKIIAFDRIVAENLEKIKD